MSATLGSGRETGTNDDYCGRGAGFWWAPLIVFGTLAAVLVGLAVAVSTGWLPGPPWGGPYPVFWPLFPLGFFLVIFLVFFALRWSWWGSGRWRGGYWGYGGPAGPGAREILRQRYARGEITREQLQQMIRDLDEIR